MEKIVKPTVEYLKASTGEDVFWVKFGDEQIAEWCLSLSLLYYGLIEAILLPCKPFNLKIRLDRKLSTGRGRVSKFTDGLEVNITINELNHWLSFFLQYYRDGISPVDHIDIDMVSQVNASEVISFQMALMVSNATPPVHWQEMDWETILRKRPNH
jgi:hypothetical protein